MHASSSRETGQHREGHGFIPTSRGKLAGVPHVEVDGGGWVAPPACSRPRTRFTASSQTEPRSRGREIVGPSPGSTAGPPSWTRAGQAEHGHGQIPSEGTRVDHTGRSMLCFNCLARSFYLRAATPTGSQEESSDVTLHLDGPLTRSQASRSLVTDARQPQWARLVPGAQRQPPSFRRRQPSQAGHSPHPSRTVVPTAAPRERENSGLGLALCVPAPPCTGCLERRGPGWSEHLKRKLGRPGTVYSGHVMPPISPVGLRAPSLRVGLVLPVQDPHCLPGALGAPSAVKQLG